MTEHHHVGCCQTQVPLVHPTSDRQREQSHEGHDVQGDEHVQLRRLAQPVGDVRQMSPFIAGLSVNELGDALKHISSVTCVYLVPLSANPEPGESQKKY